ncbi:triose-phosphate isomerase [Buchnera aphidicola]|jgi:triosephosphate isomerase|uniref:Triosephosphate isomerase n=1 Tax=Buchnera aphidicola subsp. Schizaphis graminum (strain Sg) TaxID=198804 RepID=TPIS_BUCAP|nr:triose-phosphate isomerase [Buchnera aphidicola]Q59179.1 RecName: Full=Triosephosphate isomerase; Short=TIM; Short=TPI; AltName: Full=Triose-phosphate isomerase [Buchnera aphidicola str. Sg (Schizaphis graminum)]AAC05431.1 triosephosphate isomerase [Buchnera aphidicola]AAM67852.1 triosephosphate isomerase [Buchnera aphidicola str. Sg (Schizaphis graminum)]AWI49651.1 triose-phosphate isomerase [Buchnera aphidicola (Schizaphis graminum)]
MKKKIIAANWKLNGSIKTISYFLTFLKSQISSFLKNNIIIIAPPTVFLERVYKDINSINIHLAAQNIDVNLTGAFTGENSALMMKDIGVKYIIIGHSERRLLHNENNEIIAKKFCLVKNLNLVPILCIGETEAEKKSNKTEKILKEQLNSIFNSFGEKAFRNAVIAYEPIWSIGTGVSADPKNVQLIHKFIKNYIKKYDIVSAENLIVQYGGSVTSLNAGNFLKQPDIDGLLIGSASLKHEEFLKIIKISDSFL